ncbi:MAG: response regulator, partial [Myxococcota bacterium]
MPKTVLLADDSVTIQKVVGISLAGEDITLITVDNGDAAVEQAREKRPDVVLADIVMPGKDGYEVCQAIKSDPALQHIPVILLTGTFEAFDDERAQQVGAAAHISKPFEAQTLVDQVNRVLAGAPAAAPPAAAPAAAAPAAAAGQAPAEAFDFLDDSLGSVSAPDQEPALETETPLDLGSTADPLAFGDTTPSAGATAPTDEPSAAEQTIAMAERTIANLHD